jgi:acetyl esterase/lipase
MPLNRTAGLIVALACVVAQQATAAADDATLIGPVKSARFHTSFVRLGSDNMNGLLYEPNGPIQQPRPAVVYASPRALFDFSPAAELANRGYRVLLVKHYLAARRGVVPSPADGAAEISRAIIYLRTQSGAQRVVIMGHSDGGRLALFYANVAEHGPAACQGAEVLYPCSSAQLTGLAKPDGVVLLDADAGAVRQLSSIDPAYESYKRRNADLDIYAADNGYDAKSGATKHSPTFAARYLASQSARYNQLIDNALTRLKLLQQKRAAFTDDEPLTIPGAADGKLYYTDVALLSHTRKPHTLLQSDGSMAEVVVRSVRPAFAYRISKVGSLETSLVTTVRGFLANDAIRTTKDYAVTEDDILGVDWQSSNGSAPRNAAGTRVPTLVLTANCSWLVVPSEIVYDHLAAVDKTYTAVDGALHDFTACKPAYGDTKKRAFDFVDSWLAKPGRF